ncbi:hypothetical protein [Streptacidiphilus melanogenes]|uniref:hypothetical protein n=1 Tax=Streptacidiphilus melanogenes TaxID=411235 RepID=UPI00126A703C|nr:hypothetical protein [Streptacidiphilus melanogenes]
MTSILVLNRPPLIHMPYGEWLGPDIDIRMITGPGALGGRPAPEGVVVIEDYDSSGLVEQAAVEMYRERPYDLIIALSEYDLMRAGRLREVLGLPGQDYAGALAFRDKVVMKDHWRDAGVPATAYAPLRTAADLAGFVGEHGFPVVVKPRLGTGSRAVAVLRDEDDVHRWLTECWSLPLSDISTWMVESFVEGEMLHVDGLYNAGEMEIAWPSTITSLLGFHERRPTFSAMLDPDDPAVADCRDLVRRSLEGLPSTELAIFHAELWRTPDGTLLMNEIAARQGGGKIGPAVRAAFDVHLMRRYVRLAVLGQEEPTPPARPRQCAGWALIPPHTGTVLAASQPDGHFDQGWMVEASVSVRARDRLYGAGSSIDAVASCLVTGDTRAEVLDRLEQFADWAGNAVRYETSEAVAGTK